MLEHVLTNDRVDLPAVAQRRALVEQSRGDGTHDQSTAGLEREVARARQALADAERAPELRRLSAATTALDAAQAELRAAQHALRTAPMLRRRGPADRVKTAELAYGSAADRHAVAARDAAPSTAVVEARRADVEQAERAVSAARIRDRLNQLATQRPSMSLGRAVGIPPPGR